MHRHPLMRRAVAPLAMAAASVVLPACSSGHSSPTASTAPGATTTVTARSGSLHGRLPAAIASAGTIRVDIVSDRPPFIFSNPGQPEAQGIDGDLLREIGRLLGVQINFVTGQWELTRSDVLAHDVDLAIGGQIDTAGLHTAGADYVDYLSGSAAIIVPKGNPDGIADVSNLCGRVVASQPSTVGNAVVSEQGPPCAATGHAAPIQHVLTAHDQMVSSLALKLFPAAVDDTLVAQYLAHKTSVAIEVAAPGLHPIIYGIMVAKDRAQLGGAVQAALQSMIASGTYDQILARWDATASALKTAAISGGT